MIWTYVPPAIRDRLFLGAKIFVIFYLNLLFAFLIGAAVEYLTGDRTLFWAGLAFIGLCVLTLNSRGARERLRLY